MRLLLFAMLFISCTDAPKSNDVAAQSSHQKIDTVNTKAYPVTSSPNIFETAFFRGTCAKMDTFTINFYAVDMGKINIESGKVIACDPIVLHDATPFLQSFPTGHFPVQLAIARVNNDERVAFSRILFSDGPVVKWEYALQQGQRQMPLGDENFYGYGVDAGIGLFIDQAASQAFSALLDRDQKLWEQVFINEMEKHSHLSWQYTLYNFGGHNLASFSTGYGDGTYGTYVGYDSNGRICRLLTDFGLVQWWKK